MECGYCIHHLPTNTYHRVRWDIEYQYCGMQYHRKVSGSVYHVSYWDASQRMILTSYTQNLDIYIRNSNPLTIVLYMTGKYYSTQMFVFCKVYVKKKQLQ